MTDTTGSADGFRFDPYSPRVDADPFPLYKTLRDEHPCFWSDDARMWVLSRYADIMRALADWRTYSSASGNLLDELPNRAGNTLGSTDPPRHDRLRALIQHAFMKRNLESVGPAVETYAAECLDALADRPQFDFVADFSSKVTTKSLFLLLGLPPGNDQEVRAKAVLMVQSDPATRSKGPQHLAAYEWMTDYATRVIEQRKQSPGEDLLSQLVAAEIDGERLADREVLLTTTTLIMAGIESLGSFLTMFALNLADFPDARARLVKEPALIPDAIEESLRLNTSAQRFRRRLTQDTQLHGQTMRQGDFVILAYGSANRDERQFPNPDAYDITRKTRGHLGFGGGVHACIGSALARMTVATVFKVFLERVPQFRRIEPVPPWVPSGNFRSPIRLLLARG
jgi:cytochrome P450